MKVNFCDVYGICDTIRVSNEPACYFYERGFKTTIEIYKCKYNVDPYGHPDVNSCCCDRALAEALLEKKLEDL